MYVGYIGIQIECMYMDVCTVHALACLDAFCIHRTKCEWRYVRCMHRYTHFYLCMWMRIRYIHLQALGCIQNVSIRVNKINRKIRKLCTRTTQHWFKINA